MLRAINSTTSTARVLSTNARLINRSVRVNTARKTLTTMSTSTDNWPQEDTRRMLHAVYRVGPMDEYCKFMDACFGMKQLRYRDIPDEKYTNAFIGFGPETTNFCMELTYNYGVDSYDIGTGFGHFGIAVNNVVETCDKIRAAGYEANITRPPGPVKGGKTQIAFVKDPAGYSWELIERPDSNITEPLAQVMLRVTDLERSIKFYTEVLGCKLLRRRVNEQYKYELAFLAYGDEEDNCVFELTYNFGDHTYTKGEAYAQVAISTTDVYKTAESVRAAGGTIVREPGPVPGIGTKIVSITDPDGWKVVFVDNEDFLKEL